MIGVPFIQSKNCIRPCLKGGLPLNTDFTQGSILKKLSMFMLPVLGALILQCLCQPTGPHGFFRLRCRQQNREFFHADSKRTDAVHGLLCRAECRCRQSEARQAIHVHGNWHRTCLWLHCLCTHPIQRRFSCRYLLAGSRSHPEGFRISERLCRRNDCNGSSIQYDRLLQRQ